MVQCDIYIHAEQVQTMQFRVLHYYVTIYTYIIDNGYKEIKKNCVTIYMHKVTLIYNYIDNAS